MHYCGIKMVIIQLRKYKQAVWGAFYPCLFKICIPFSDHFRLYLNKCLGKLVKDFSYYQHPHTHPKNEKNHLNLAFFCVISNMRLCCCVLRVALAKDHWQKVTKTQHFSCFLLSQMVRKSKHTTFSIMQDQRKKGKLAMMLLAWISVWNGFDCRDPEKTAGVWIRSASRGIPRSTTENRSSA